MNILVVGIKGYITHCWAYLNEEVSIHSYVKKTSKTNEEGEDLWKIRFETKKDVVKFIKYLDALHTIFSITN